MRIELSENALDNIVGGTIQCTYQGGSGTIWIKAKSPKEYSFTNYGVVSTVNKMQNDGYSDQEIIDYLKGKNAIW